MHCTGKDAIDLKKKKVILDRYNLNLTGDEIHVGIVAPWRYTILPTKQKKKKKSYHQEGLVCWQTQE